MKVGIKSAVVGVLTLGAALIGWELAQRTGQKSAVENRVAGSVPAAQPAPPELLTERQSPGDRHTEDGPPDAVETTQTAPATRPEEVPISVRLNRWLRSSADLDVVAANIAREFPTVRPEDHAAVVHELIPLVTDEHYPLLARILLDTTTHPAALDKLFRNLTYRPDNIELPMEMELLRMGERHPLSEDARIKLAVRFGEDYGNDWNRWLTRVAQELRGR